MCRRLQGLWKFCRFGMRSIGKIRYWNEVRVNSNCKYEQKPYKNFVDIGVNDGKM